MRDWVTTVLDALALLGFAAGVGMGASRWIGWFGLALAALIVGLGSWLSARPRRGESQ